MNTFDSIVKLYPVAVVRNDGEPDSMMYAETPLHQERLRAAAASQLAGCESVQKVKVETVRSFTVRGLLQSKPSIWSAHHADGSTVTYYCFETLSR